MSETMAKRYIDFNPRSRGGSDVHSNESCVVIDDFNPRSRGGSDFIRMVSDEELRISIHAPAEGATKRYRNTMSNSWNFNPRSRGGSDDQPAMQYGA